MKRKIAVFLLCLLLCGCTAVQEGTRTPERKAENQSEAAVVPLVPKLSEIRSATSLQKRTRKR